MTSVLAAGASAELCAVWVVYVDETKMILSCVTAKLFVPQTLADDANATAAISVVKSETILDVVWNLMEDVALLQAWTILKVNVLWNGMNVE